MARPREFDVDRAIGTATSLFLNRGYRATSISDLTDAIGILRGSLYKAFPDKHSLLLTVLDRYRMGQIDTLRASLNASGSSTLANLRQSMTIQPGGCLITGLTLELMPHDTAVTKRIIRHYEQVTELFEEALQRLRFEGTLRRDVKIPVVARLMVTTLQGLRVMSRTSQDSDCVELLMELVTDHSPTLTATAGGIPHPH